MQLIETLNRYPWPLYLIGGLFLGMFIGYQVLPQMMQRKAAPVTAADSASQLESQRPLEQKLAVGLVQIEGVEDAHVQLSVSLAGTRKAHARASITLTLAGADPSVEQLEGIAELVAASVGGLQPGLVTITDASGRSLNGEAVVQHERKLFWTGIAINVAKILGILAAMITIRFIVRSIHRQILGEDGGC